MKEKSVIGKDIFKMTIPPNLYICLWVCMLLSHFSCVQLCATPQMAAHQAPPSLGLSRQEHWSGLPFPSPMQESEVVQPCLTLSDPIDRSLPGSPVHGIFRATVLGVGCHCLFPRQNEWLKTTFFFFLLTVLDNRNLNSRYQES